MSDSTARPEGAHSTVGGNGQDHNRPAGADATPGSPLDAALAYRRAGLSVIPVRTDGSKQPAVAQWKRFQKDPPPENAIRAYWSEPRGIAVVCGRVSGNAECIDFDRGDLFGPWCEVVEAQAPGLLSRLSVVRTPGGGNHVWYRCSGITIPGNTKLAMELGTDPKTGRPTRETLIETRGEGGYALAPGSPPACHPSGRTYEHVAGPSLTNLAEITPQEREVLIAAARSFDLMAAAGKPETPKAKGAGTGLRPGDDYDRNGPPFPEILEPHGWEQGHRQGEKVYWRRPGKDTPGYSATTGYCRGKNGEDLLAVFSTNAYPFEGPTGSRACTCHGKFAAYALLNHGGDFKAAAKELARQGYGDQQHRHNGQTPSAGGGDSAGERPTIPVTTEEHEVNEEAAKALARDPHIYQRANQLVRVVRDSGSSDRGIRRPFAPRIEVLPPALLRERLAANARFITLRETKEGIQELPARPPGWCVSAVHARGEWAGVRRLEAVAHYPVLRPDGSLLCSPGYDPDTGLLLEAVKEFPPVPDHPGMPEAQAARDALLEAVEDFPFEREAHRAAWLAALLTPLARFAFVGPAPLFLVDANVRGAGKGLLLDIISLAVYGESFTIATYTQDEDELRKRITSLVLAGDQLVLFDNLEGRFGNATLDAALTGTSWKDRVLGVNRMAEAPLFMTWYATGNNVSVMADTARRVCHIRLESPEERPEERQDLRHPDLRSWVRENRGRLLAAALTILRGYCAAGRPDMRLPAWGSFEGWSALVRPAVVWAGMEDPGQTRVLLQEQADVTAESMAVVLSCWERMDPERRGLTAAEVIHQLYKEPPSPVPDYHAELKAALETMLGRPDARGLGNRLRSYRRRVFRGRYIDRTGLEHSAARWAVHPAGELRRRPTDTPRTPHTP
ncbi:MAG TPA: bifunctional DNA primase/polymerase, partial [Gemmataceae bacterium]|nr:bifunctional DNA primase/polymerase [Gemmataceae bacterium]